MKANSKNSNNGNDWRLRRRIFYNSLFSKIGFVLSLSALFFIVVLLFSLVGNGHRAFYQSYISVQVSAPTLEVLDDDSIGPEQGFLQIRRDIKNSLISSLDLAEADSAIQKEALGLLSQNATFYAYEQVRENPGSYADNPIWVPTSSDVDQYLKSKDSSAQRSFELSPSQRQHIEHLQSNNVLQQKFSSIFLTSSDSRLPEMAGIYGAVLGTFYTLLVTFLLAIPLGISSAIYLQEFARRNRMVELIEININNLAAVPSIIFGLLGLGIFISMMGMPRSVPLVGGVVLALMTFPTIVVASRQALLAVPINIREGALSLGATRHQMIFHHVIPFAMPSMMTGSIIGMAQALGETAPLLMLGMVAFIANAPGGVLDPSTTLPVQIFLWADSPERGLVEKTIGAILVLIGFLILMNLLTVYVRYRFENIRAK